MNGRPSTPLCEGCLASELLCQACMWEDNQPCCSSCVHRREGHATRVDGITLTRPQADNEPALGQATSHDVPQFEHDIR